MLAESQAPKLKTYVSRSALLRSRWFAEGAEALHRLRPDFPRLYVCPICGRGFVEQALSNGMLTLEHVPPRSMGGRRLVLTCRDCNARAGHMMDVHAYKREKILDFVQGTLREPLGAQLVVDDTVVNIQVTAIDRHISMWELPNLNHPDRQAALVKNFEASTVGLLINPEFSIRLAGASYPSSSRVSR